MRLSVMTSLVLFATVAHADLPPDSVLIGSQGAGANLSQLVFNDGTSVTTGAEPGVSGGNFTAMALGADNRVWSLHTSLNTLVATDGSGIGESFDLTATANDWEGMTGTASGRVFLLRNQGDVYEVDTATGNLSITSLNQAVIDGQLATHIAAEGERVYVHRFDAGEPNGSVDVYNAATGSLISNFDVNSPRNDWAMIAHPSGDVIFSWSPDAIAVQRQGPGGDVWFDASYTDAVLALTLATDGTLWALQADGDVYIADADTGARLNGGLPIASGFTLSDWTGGSLLAIDYSGLPNPPTDVCPDNPRKFDAPGVCGCDFFDVVGPDFNNEGELRGLGSQTGDSGGGGPILGEEGGEPGGGTPLPPDPYTGMGCVHVTADYDESATIGDGAYVLAYATVGEGVEIANNATVGERSSVGDYALLGFNTLISRTAQVGAGTVVGDDTTIGRSAIIGEEATIGASVSIGYATQLGDGAFVAENSVIGNLVTANGGDVQFGNWPDPRFPGSPSLGVVIGRGNTFTGDVYLGDDVVIGPGGTFGNDFGTDDGVRIRKNVTAGDFVSIDGDVVIGRDVVFVGNNEVRNDSNLGASARMELNACVPEQTNVPRNGTVNTNTCD